MTDSTGKTGAGGHRLFCFGLGLYSFAVAAEVPVASVAGIGAILFRLFGLRWCDNIIMFHPLC